MLNNRKLVVDKFTDIGELFPGLVDEFFWSLDHHTIVPNAVYIIGHGQFDKHTDYIKQLVNGNIIKVVFGNIREGSATVEYFLNKYNIEELVASGKIILLAGGDTDKKYNTLVNEYFLSAVINHSENKNINNYTDKIYLKKNKAYKFLFLNGRKRAHRHYLLNKFKESNLLLDSLWTNLELPFEIKSLPYNYEGNLYKENISNINNNNFVIPISSVHSVYAKEVLFNNNVWGDGAVTPQAYIDTYFSLITETVFDYPCSFRTEKTWKPVLIGHPFIVASNAGYYRDLRNLGFKTFGHLVDESFDTIDNNQDRIDRIAATVTDLCSQDLPAFLQAAKETCKYNQQHAIELNHRSIQEFPQRFINFINERSRI